jgi:hypothetical protein
LDNDHTSIKGGPFTHGVYRAKKGENVYGLVEVFDKGDVILMKFSGKNDQHNTILEMSHLLKVK